eukprot:TRINITY_DN4357_c0_g1_i1.p2 TRINITY_DN4357_c0_g1~~TRINITY_DN4357_c0_g1_i1.p2  ORF type:complete len:268 (-),score=-32.78 TRINITY_DN4357_c0_g1_i1:351-1154(-)
MTTSRIVYQLIPKRINQLIKRLEIIARDIPRLILNNRQLGTTQVIYNPVRRHLSCPGCPCIVGPNFSQNKISRNFKPISFHHREGLHLIKPFGYSLRSVVQVLWLDFLWLLLTQFFLLTEKKRKKGKKYLKVGFLLFCCFFFDFSSLWAFLYFPHAKPTKWTCFNHRGGLNPVLPFGKSPRSMVESDVHMVLRGHRLVLQSRCKDPACWIFSSSSLTLLQGGKMNRSQVKSLIFWLKQEEINKIPLMTEGPICGTPGMVALFPPNPS